MNTRILFVASAICMGAAGSVLTFAPEELRALSGSLAPSVVLQLCGALYCGFALMNWMAKGLVLGGIYGRPIVIGNVVVFTMAALALFKASFVGHSYDVWLLLSACAHGFFALLFGRAMMTHPKMH